MPGDISDLTEKEKEALRLLVAGHDAKSSATVLDISVHTVNDRLRNARRKLGVSSSREAARILGEAEGADPQKPAHKPIGMAAASAPPDTADLVRKQPRGPFGLTWLAGGMLIMSVLIAAAVIGVVYSSGASTPDAARHSASSERPSAEAPVSLGRAEAFLASVDAFDWDASWKKAGSYFQSQVTAREWADNVEPVRKPLGTVKERRLSNVQRASTLPGAPEGEYEILQFQTAFSKRSGIAVETVVMLAGDEGWEVVGYFVNPGVS